MPVIHGGCRSVPWQSNAPGLRIALRDPGHPLVWLGIVFPVGWLPMLSWAIGPISSYAEAYGLSVGVTLAGVACAALWVILHHALPIMRRGSS